MKRAEDNFMKPSRAADSRGFSLIELLIVVAMTSIVVTFAVMKIAGAQRAMRLTNSAREFMGWLEKARLDSLRRHAMSKPEMANVTISSTNTYSVVIDQNGDGQLDPPRVISFPGTHGATFTGIAIPTTIYYNWRGRPLDAAGKLVNLKFGLNDASGNNNNPIEVTGEGGTLLDTNISVGAVNVSQGANSSSNIKSKTSVP